MKHFYLVFTLFIISFYANGQASLGIIYSNELDNKPSKDDNKISHENKYSLGINSSLNISPALTISYGLLYTRTNYSGGSLLSDPENSFIFSGLKQELEIPVHLRWYFASRDKKINPYVLGGIRFEYQLKNKANYNQASERLNFEEGWERDPTNLEVGAGLDYKLSKNLYLNTQISFKTRREFDWDFTPNFQTGIIYRFRKK